MPYTIRRNTGDIVMSYTIQRNTTVNSRGIGSEQVLILVGFSLIALYI